ICFLSADSFEQTIRNAISLGGDTDTLACIAGSIAEAYYGLDEKIWSKAKRYLTDEILELLGEFDSSIEDVYIDVDGVILSEDGKQMLYLKEFLTLIFNISENVYWLSNYCKDGDTSKVLEYLEGKIDKEVLEMLKNVKGKKWGLFRTEGIDFLKRFVWFSGKVDRNQYIKLEILHKDHNLIVVENNLEEMIELFKRQ
ncbi:MAG TPA: ADP-ribosylglycohydrolase family protein, partial [Candidatus Dojkabacteria bacterium]|nr:ADP-ribosylglycohydrolase family protein [Candidatus Dojkabacteria bacterium]